MEFIRANMDIRSMLARTAMRNRAAEFVERWEFDHIKVVADSERAEEARRLAARCREDAAKAGISAADLHAAVEGDLTGNMTTALAAAAFRRMAVEQWADEE
jgi:hypothetical protein